MLIINVASPNGPEKAVQRALAGMPGVLIGNPKVPVPGGRAAETDALVITPAGVFVVEAKGFKKDTPNSGVLEVPMNGGWTIGGQPAQFYGDKEAPSLQARQAAQRFAGYLREQGALKRFISAIVSISAARAEMPTGPVALGDVVVSLDKALPDAVKMLPESAPVTLAQAWDIINALGLAPSLLPSKEAVAAEGFPEKSARQAPPSKTTSSQTSTPPHTGKTHEPQVRHDFDQWAGTSAPKPVAAKPSPEELFPDGYPLQSLARRLAEERAAQRDGRLAEYRAARYSRSTGKDSPAVDSKRPSFVSKPSKPRQAYLVGVVVVALLILGGFLAYRDMYGLSKDDAWGTFYDHLENALPDDVVVKPANVECQVFHDSLLPSGVGYHCLAYWVTDPKHRGAAYGTITNADKDKVVEFEKTDHPGRLPVDSAQPSGE